jgi:hypothetical protein
MMRWDGMFDGYMMWGAGLIWPLQSSAARSHMFLPLTTAATLVG